MPQALCISPRTGWPVSTVSPSPAAPSPRGFFTRYSEFLHLPRGTHCLPSQRGVLQTRVLQTRPRGLEATGSGERWRAIKQSILKHVPVVSRLGLPYLPSWRMNLSFLSKALRKAPSGSFVRPVAHFHPAHSDFLSATGLQSDPAFRRHVEEERDDSRSRHAECSPLAGSGSGCACVVMLATALGILLSPPSPLLQREELTHGDVRRQSQGHVASDGRLGI